MVELMLGLIRAFREGGCLDVAPCFYSCNGSLVLCAWSMPVIFHTTCTMHRWPVIALDHADVHEQFLHGQGFFVQLGGNNFFGRIPVNQTIEETTNKDTQTRGRNKGLQLKTWSCREVLPDIWIQKLLHETADIHDWQKQLPTLQSSRPAAPQD